MEMILASICPRVPSSISYKKQKDNYVLQYNESLIQEQTKTIFPVSDWMQETEPALN